MPVGRPGTTVAVIGLGAMGDPIARRLLAAGFPVRVTSRSDRLGPAFEAAGATWCDTPAEVAAGADVILIVVATEADLADVLTGPGRLLEAIAPDTMICDLGTHAPAAMVQAEEEVHAAGGVFLDAPLSGGVEAPRPAPSR